MAVSIRLTKRGKKDYPTYRIVVVDKRKKRDSDYIEKIGFYNPHTEPGTLQVNKERFDFWLKKGAIVSEGVRKLLKKIKKSN
ncbi:MAG: 30S ribosomal protein S16 [Patescibacteria group bacterium]|nr:30S ribosomal protein S16 [Patescibacteria group bacterium]